MVTADRRVPVTPKEREVLAAVVERLTNAEIAARLFISERTVETHVSSLLRKYQVRSRRELIRAAIGEARWEPVDGSLPGVLARVVSSGAMVGRQTELERLLTVWSEVVGGRSRTVLVVGEAGIGKTRLVAEFALQVLAGGGDVVFGACHDDEVRPFGPLAETLLEARAAEPEDAASHRMQVRPDVDDAATEQARAICLLSGHLAARAQRRPTLLLIDDVHWATPTTRIALLDVVRHADGPGLLVAMTSRTGPADVDDEVAVMLGAIDKTPGTVRLHLGGLTLANVGLVVGGHRVELDPARLLADTGGNPLLIREILDGPDRHTGSSVQGLLLSRARRLSTADNELLDTAAIIGVEFDVTVLADSVGLDVGQVVDALARCESVGLVDAHSTHVGQYYFVHALFRSVRLGALPVSRRIQLHHRVARALARRPLSALTVAALARHACAAAPLGDLAFASDCARRAGDLFMDELAIDEAADLYRMGLSVTEMMNRPHETIRCELLVRLGQAAIDHESSPGLVLEAARTGLAVGRLDLVADALYVMAGFRPAFDHDDAALALARRALAAANDGDLAVRARLTCVLALQAPGLDDREQRHKLMADAIELARAAKDPRLLAQVLAWSWWATFHPGNLEARQQLADELLILSRREQLPLFELHARQSRRVGMLESGDLTTATREAAEIERIIGTRTDTYTRAMALSLRASSEFIRGDLEAAEAAGEELLSVLRRLRATRPDAMLLNYGPHFWNVRFAQGRIDELFTLVTANQAHRPDAPALQALRARIAARAGAGDEAQAILGQLLANGVDSLPPDLGWYATLSALGDVAHVLCDVDAARTLAGALAPCAGRFVVQGASVSEPVDVVRAGLALTLGDPADAVEIAGRAAVHARSHGAPIFTARALVLEAAGRKQLGQRKDADAALAVALTIANQTRARVIELDAARLRLL
jgi:DNA-binding CsgD family transcriptional regulator